MPNLKKKQCDCDTDPHPFLIFDKDRESPEKEKIRSFWKKFKSSNAELQKREQQNAQLESEKASHEDLEEDEDLELNENFGIDEDLDQEEKDLICVEETVKDVQNNGAKELFEKMVALRIDQHALAIKDGYRIRPQVCICDDECCSCFDYSPFLHNLKLHGHKKLLAEEYDRMLKAQKQLNAADDGSRLIANGSDRSLPDGISSSGLSELYESKFAKAGTKQNDPDPPYESRFNSTHGRLREFDPNLYKFHVRKETRKYNDKRPSRPENQTQEPAMRPTWRI